MSYLAGQRHATELNKDEQESWRKNTELSKDESTGFEGEVLLICELMKYSAERRRATNLEKDALLLINT